MKPLFPTLNVPSIKPQVLGLVVDADHEISTNDGTIYVQLHPTDDEMYAEIHFNFEMDYKFIPAEYMDGYVVYGDGVELGNHTIQTWEVITVEGCEWSPSVDDKVMIKILINKWIDGSWTMVMAMICLVGLVLRAKIVHQLSCLSSSALVKWRTGNHCPNHHRRQNVDRITAQKFADVYGIDKIKQIIANCPQNCDVYREYVGDTIIRQIPIGVFQTVLVTLGHEPNPTKELNND